MTLDGYSKAAMRLARLGSEDRQWLLGELAEDDRTRLLKHLRDSSSMLSHGGVQDRIESLDRGGRARPVAASNQQRTESDDRATITMADGGELSVLLQKEPAWVVAALLTHAEWPWADAYMESCTPERLERITTAMKVEIAGITSRVRQTILSSLAQRLQQQSAVARPLSPFERVLSRAEKKVSEAWKNRSKDE